MSLRLITIFPRREILDRDVEHTWALKEYVAKAEYLKRTEVLCRLWPCIGFAVYPYSHYLRSYLGKSCIGWAWFQFFITEVCIMQEFLTVRLVAHTNKVIKTMAVASMILLVTWGERLSPCTFVPGQWVID